MAPESIHLCNYPIVNDKAIDTELEDNMMKVLKFVVLGRACRNSVNIKNRQPVGKMYVKSDKKLEDFYLDIVKEELNVKEIEFTDDVRKYTTYSFKPNLKTVGPKYGKMLNSIRTKLSELNGNEAMMS